jgi:tetratricopeptide (TPR) repeat protein
MLQAGWWAAVTTYYWLGEFEQSIAYADRILAQYDPQRHRVLASMLNHDPKTVALQYKASSLAMLGLPDSAVITMRAAVAHARERGHAFDYAWALFFAIYQLHATLRDVVAVDELLGVLTELAREQRLIVFEKVLGPYAMAVRDFLQGADAVAATRVEQLIPVLAAAGVNVVLWEAKTTHAKCAVNQGHPEAALAHTTEVMAMSAQRDSDTRYLHVEVMRVHAKALRASGNLVQAERTLCDAIELARRQKAKWWELRVTTEFARLMHQAGRSCEGIAMLETLCGSFEEGRRTPDFKDAEGVLACLRSRDATSA